MQKKKKKKKKKNIGTTTVLISALSQAATSAGLFDHFARSRKEFDG